jgi:hypothetical protein
VELALQTSLWNIAPPACLTERQDGTGAARAFLNGDHAGALRSVDERDDEAAEQFGKLISKR